MDKNYFEVLNSINVNDKIEKKNTGGTELSYLSWSWAWAEVKKRYPDATYEIIKYDGLPYVYDAKTGYMVYTTVTIQGMTHEMWLPVMDGNNRAMKAEPYTITTKYGKEIPVASATMFDINKTLMRCLTKNLAVFGLGLYLYSGEDVPEGEEKETKEKTSKKSVKPTEAKPEPAEVIPLTEEELLFLSSRYKGDNLTKLLDYYKIEDISLIEPTEGRNLIAMIKAKKGGNDGNK